MTEKIRVRFAPSPTGYLHIGGARTTLFNWLFARRMKGTFVLRIEDTDEVRSTPDSVSAIVDSIRWMGLDWDEGPELTPGPDGRYASKGPHAPYFQMERVELYKKFAAQLLEQGKAYRCYCSKDELDAMRRQAQLEKRPPRYDGRCRDLTEAQRKALEAQGKQASVRLRMPDDGTTVVPDMIRGDVSFENALQQDFVIVKTTGGPTYNFACVIDDHAMGITHVIRGDEHLPNTPSQIQLYKALGWELPKFAHLSMILGPDGAKLSKRHGATSVLEYKTQGYLPETMRNYLALLGWSTKDSQQLFEPQELIEKFDLEGCQKNPATFDPVKLDWMNGEYLRKMTKETLLDRAMPFIEAAGLGQVPREKLLPAVALEHEKYKHLSDIPRLVEFFFKGVEYDPKAVDKVLKKDGVDAVLDGLAALLEKVEPFQEKPLEDAIRAFVAEKGLKPGQVFHPLRVAVSGRTEGPTLFGMVELLGRAEAVARLRRAKTLLAAA
ncbi:MAG TPA: glutamate--tRNA ligase [Elusimicrobiota bacterium]|jgi:glutamyl-tRNA synthetase|nr:glutamate--tRNA ligase [Elusimicrobiota bacterium]